MKPSVLLLVTSDPRRSGRPLEALRIAAGVGVWQKANVTIYLRDEAVRMLGELNDELINPEYYARYWSILAKGGQFIYLQDKAPLLALLSPIEWPCKEISTPQLVELSSRQDHVLRF